MVVEVVLEVYLVLISAVLCTDATKHWLSSEIHKHSINTRKHSENAPTFHKKKSEMVVFRYNDTWMVFLYTFMYTQKCKYVYTSLARRE